MLWEEALALSKALEQTPGRSQDRQVGSGALAAQMPLEFGKPHAP